MNKSCACLFFAPLITKFFDGTTTSALLHAFPNSNGWLVWVQEEREKRLQRHHMLGLEIRTSVARLIKDADASKWSNKDHNQRPRFLTYIASHDALISLLWYRVDGADTPLSLTGCS